MNGILIILRRLPASGMALFPFIMLRKKDLPHTPQLLNHERIHLMQQLELLVLPFYIWYLIEYLFYRMKGNTHHTAYRSISFEREAYQHEKDLNYLKGRKRWAYLRTS
ncbi:MAG: hypothetical protein KA347_07610 [Bacteroidia bacterium]|jgi:cytochrome bd-type quinol oxidase subunit 2|nr:hypothetical protein [Bacteroidota bacterium]MBP6512518.1 hypothetical protein [Bacteroidia bacterium]